MRKSKSRKKLKRYKHNYFGQVVPEGFEWKWIRQLLETDYRWILLKTNATHCYHWRHIHKHLAAWSKKMQISYLAELSEFTDFIRISSFVIFLILLQVIFMFTIGYEYFFHQLSGKVYFLSSHWLLMNCNGLKTTSTSPDWPSKRSPVRYFRKSWKKIWKIFQPWLIEFYLDRAHSVNVFSNSCWRADNYIGDVACVFEIQTFEWQVFAALRLGVGRVWWLE